MENRSVQKASAAATQSLFQPSSDEAAPGPSLDRPPMDTDPMDIDPLDGDPQKEHQLRRSATAPASSQRRNDSDDSTPKDPNGPDISGQIPKSISGNAHHQTPQAGPPTSPRNCEVLEDEVASPESATTVGEVKQPPSIKDHASRRAQSDEAQPTAQESPLQGQTPITSKEQQQPDISRDAAMNSDESSFKPIKPTDSAKVSPLEGSDDVPSGSTEHTPSSTPPAHHVHSKTPFHSNFHDDESDGDSKSDEMAEQLGEIKEKLHALEAELAKKEDEADMYKRYWKRTALEVERVRPRQWFDMATDRVLTNMAKSLSYNIRSFAIQYFEGEGLGQKPLGRSRTVSYKTSKASTTGEKYGEGKPSSKFVMYLTEAAPGINAYRRYLRSPRKCPTIIQSFLWRVLDGEVFGKFLWAGTDSEHMRALDERLEAHASSVPGDTEAERRYMNWRATTTALLFNPALMEKFDAWQKMRWAIADEIRDVLTPYRARVGGSRDDSFYDQILDILSEALTLDREISKQTTRVNWNLDSLTGEFDSQLMKLHEGESASSKNSQVLLVVSPAMTRQGPNSAGRSSENQIILLPMEVSCEPLSHM